MGSTSRAAATVAPPEPTHTTAPDERKEIDMTKTTTTHVAPATTASTPLHWGFVYQGQAVLGLARLLDGYEAVRWDNDPRERHEDSQQCVQADAAVWAASHGWLWQGLCEAQTKEDLYSLAWACEERARDRYDSGCGWQAEVWEAVASYIWGLAA